MDDDEERIGVAYIYTSSSVGHLQGQCERCGFDSLEHLKIHQLGDDGVGILAEAIRCSRCDDEEDD